MHKITYISTVHEEYEKCNAFELCEIISEIKPEVIFLEALEESYSGYQDYLFNGWGIFHKKLEIHAMQLYCTKTSFIYVPVLDQGMPKYFDKKYNIVSQHADIQNYLNTLRINFGKYGFQFLNSKKNIEIHRNMRKLEKELVNEEVENLAWKAIDEYENNMFRNIYSFCKDNIFEKAIFMCGAAHRESIIKKINQYNISEDIKLNWDILEYEHNYND